MGDFYYYFILLSKRWQGVLNGKIGWFPKIYVDDKTVEVKVILRWFHSMYLLSCLLACLYSARDCFLFFYFCFLFYLVPFAFLLRDINCNVLTSVYQLQQSGDTTKVCAIRAYEAANAEELSFPKGALMIVTTR